MPEPKPSAAAPTHPAQAAGAEAHGRQYVEEPGWLDLLGVEQPMLRRLGTYWQQLRGDRPMPARSDLQPWAIPDLLPSLWMWRVESEPRAFHLRLCGDRINRLLGYWRRGVELGEAAPPDVAPLLRERYERVAFGPAVMRARGYVLLGRAEGVRVRAERLVLPLGNGGTLAEDLLGITWYEELPPSGATETAGPAVDATFLALDRLDF
jgi:hypothetical protein